VEVAVWANKQADINKLPSHKIYGSRTHEKFNLHSFQT
jgi:hypothetical protein